jgi:SAM-dependent methyltransferase
MELAMPTNYDEVASSYDRRYEVHDYRGIRAAITDVVATRPGTRVLEVGCGTGKWLAELAAADCVVAGLDSSSEMLDRARSIVDAELRLGVAEQLPWEASTFDAVLYVNALHHFADPAEAICEAARVLRPCGKLLSFGLDPSASRDRWYLYDFFPGALAYDRGRYPTADARGRWLRLAGFTDITVTVGEHLRASMSLPEADRAGVLEHSFTSQFDGLSESEYEAGRNALKAAADSAPSFRLVADLVIYATTARKPPRSAP